MNGNIWFTTSEPSFARTVSNVGHQNRESYKHKSAKHQWVWLPDARPYDGSERHTVGTVIGAPAGGGGACFELNRTRMNMTFPPPKGSSGAGTRIEWTRKETSGATTSFRGTTVRSGHSNPLGRENVISSCSVQLEAGSPPPAGAPITVAHSMPF